MPGPVFWEERAAFPYHFMLSTRGLRGYYAGPTVAYAGACRKIAQIREAGHAKMHMKTPRAPPQRTKKNKCKTIGKPEQHYRTR